MFIDTRGIVTNDGAILHNGQGHGAVGQGLAAVRFEPGLLRPYVDNRGNRVVNMQTGRYIQDPKTGLLVPEQKKFLINALQARGINSPVFNATTLVKEAWIEFDRAVVRATRNRLRAWNDLAASSTRGGFNAMSRMTLEYQAMTDPGEAVVDMDAIADARNDKPLFNLRSIPLPITHSDFWISERELAISRNSGMPLDTTMAEAAGRRVSEMIEKTVIGIETGVTYGTISSGPGTHQGTSTVYGYTNFPYRVTKTNLTTPTGSNPETMLADVQAMIETMQTNGYYGPYILYHSTGYSQMMNGDYYRTGGTAVVRSVRERLMQLEDLQDIRRLDYLTSGYQLILVQMDPEVAQAIDGMGITTVMWPSQGGLRTNFKVMAIQLPLLKAPYNGVAGIIHGTTS